MFTLLLPECIRRMFVYSDSDGSDDETATRHQVYEACRGFQAVFGEARERALKALAFAKTLRKDLEVSAEFSVNPGANTEILINKLHGSGHVRVVAPQLSQHHIFISGNIRDKQEHILQLLDMHHGSGSTSTSSDSTSAAESGSSNIPFKDDSNMGYLVLMRSDFLEEKDLNWSGDTIVVKPTADTTISLSQIEVK